MKKILLSIMVVILVLIGNYYHYENKSKEVLLLGQVVGFDVDNITIDSDNRQNQNIKLTSSKAVGTITFIEEDTNRFAALGHSISNKTSKIDLSGNCYKIEFDHVKKSTNKHEARIIADINENEKIGYLSYANNYGIFGVYDKNKTTEYKKIRTANRFDITKGEALIYLNLDGTGLKEYEVEITQINYFQENQNIRILVKSKNLINNASGIAQGMSGTPLVQNGKLIGAINCVNPDNPLDAYAIFIDKLL